MIFDAHHGSLCKQSNKILYCCGRPLLQGWLLPESKTIPNNCVRENSLSLGGCGIGFSFRRPWFKSRPDLIFLPYIYSLVSLLRTLFVRLGLIWDWSGPLIPFNVKKMDFLPNCFLSSIIDDIKRGCVTGHNSFKHGCFPI